MNTKDCWYVSNIAASRSFSKAAELLYIAPSALSRYVSNLEDRLAVKLFDRSTTPISLTPAGTLYLYYAQQFLKLEEKLEIEMDSLRSPAKTVISLGVPLILGDYIISRFLPRFWLKDSAVTINMDQDKLPYLEKKIIGHNLDIAFLCKPVSAPGYRSELITKEKIILVTSRTNPIMERYQYGTYDYQHPLELDLSSPRQAPLPPLYRSGKMVPPAALHAPFHGADHLAHAGDEPDHPKQQLHLCDEQSAQIRESRDRQPYPAHCLWRRIPAHLSRLRGGAVPQL